MIIIERAKCATEGRKLMEPQPDCSQFTDKKSLIRYDMAMRMEFDPNFVRDVSPIQKGDRVGVGETCEIEIVETPEFPMIRVKYKSDGFAQWVGVAFLRSNKLKLKDIIAGNYRADTIPAWAVRNFCTLTSKAEPLEVDGKWYWYFTVKETTCANE